MALMHASLNDSVDYASQILPLHDDVMISAQHKLDLLVKPPGSLGLLETMAVKLSGIFGTTEFDLSKRCVLVFAADNGVTEEGISVAPQSVTLAQTKNIADGISGVAVFSKLFHTDVFVYDVGINSDVQCDYVYHKKIRKGTHNIAKQPAMTIDEAWQAIGVGFDAVKAAYLQGYRMVGIGEMGIGNTTTSSAVLTALTGMPINVLTGKGAGLDADVLNHKMNVIQTALNMNVPDANRPIDVLAKVGGFDLAAMVGAYIGAAIHRIPAVIDGFISMVAACCAVSLTPGIKDFMFASHESTEPGFSIAAKQIGLPVPLKLNMGLGEGSGCPLMFAVMDAAAAMLQDMGTLTPDNIGMEYLSHVHAQTQ